MRHAAVALNSVEALPTITELVESNVALVGRLVRERLSKVPAHVSRDDLTSAGMMALVVSAQSYDPERGVPFTRFASIRIRGALMDELRGMDWATRSVRCRAREVESVRGELAVVLDRTPLRGEVADAMGVSATVLDSLQSDLARARVLSLQEYADGSAAELPPETSAGPESLILLREQLGYLHDAIAELSGRLRFVVDAYFFGHRQMSDIAVGLGVTESRVSQLCAEAVALLRDGMNSQLDPSAIAARSQSGRAAATRTAYFGAIAERGSLASRLAMSTSRGDMVDRRAAGRAWSADQRPEWDRSVPDEWFSAPSYSAGLG